MLETRQVSGNHYHQQRPSHSKSALSFNVSLGVNLVPDACHKLSLSNFTWQVVDGIMVSWMMWTADPFLLSNGPHQIQAANPFNFGNYPHQWYIVKCFSPDSVTLTCNHPHHAHTNDSSVLVHVSACTVTPKTLSMFAQISVCNM